ncbi:hypothetical protein QBC45DRAFT_457085 [Copromyces sp. CBS 386.78]|nr:hypothetical protein QBC45DRAFT_457085 [Copromyces sp. CBS 386.78]
MYRKLWPVYSCGHEQIPAQSTRTESCGYQCPEYSWGSGYYELPSDCGNVRCSTAIRSMFDKGQVKIADWKWNYGAHAGSTYGGNGSGTACAGPASVGMSYGGGGCGGGGDAGYGGYGLTPMLSGPSTSCPVHGGYGSGPMMPPFLPPHAHTGGDSYQGYGNPMLRPMSAPPTPFFVQPFFPPFPSYGGGGQGCPPPPPTRWW